MKLRTTLSTGLFLSISIVPATAQGDGVLDLSDLHNYAAQFVPEYINATPGVLKDNTPPDNPISDEGATLGRVLFYDQNLSSTNSVSCATCHQQENAFSDLANRSLGVDGLTPRHSMRLINVRWAEESRFRWDEAAATLEEQMTIPIRKEDEMGYSGTNGQPSFSDLIAEMETTSYYPALFTLAFGDSTITEERMQRALAQFLRSIQSFDSKYDVGRAQVASHDDDFPNFSAAENAGKRLFTEDFDYVTDTIVVNGESFLASRRVSGGFNCATCHQPPEFDIDAESLNNGFIRPSPPGPGNPFDFDVTRSPTLRDTVHPDGSLNGGMFHAGQAQNLNLIFAHYDFRQIEPTNNNLDPRMTPAGLPQWLDATQQERQQLSAFMNTLTGGDVYTNEKWSDPFDASGQLVLVGAIPYGQCTSSNAPCGNPDPGAGCANSTGVGGRIHTEGSASVADDDLFLVGTQLPPNQFGIFFLGTDAIFVPFGDGLRAVGGDTNRFTPPLNASASGSLSLGPIVGYTQANFPVSHQITASSTWNFQLWYRDPAGPCGSAFNLSNGLSITFAP